MEEGTKLDAGLSVRAKAIANFEEKLAKFIELIANKPKYSRNTRQYLLNEAASTSEFPILFGTVLERTLLSQYQMAKPDYRAYIKTGTQRDFRPVDVIGMYGLQGPLKTVAAGSEYKEDAQIGSGKLPQIILAKYGRKFGLAWEIVINDDLGAFSDIAQRLANAAIRTEYRLATGLFATGTGPNTGLFGAALTHPIDGTAVANLNTATAFGVDNLGVVCNKLRRQKDSDGEPILIDGFDVVVPPALEVALWQALNPAAIVAAGGDSTAGAKMQTKTSANVVVQNLNIVGHVNPYLPILDASGNADKTWYVFANLASGYAAKVNFLAGHENPELVMKASDKQTMAGGAVDALEGDFETDSLSYRVRHIAGGNIADPRMAQASIG
jgi:hypothetical protein